MRNAITTPTLLLAVLLAAPAIGANEKKNNKNDEKVPQYASKLIKDLAPIGLTSEQTRAIQSLAAKTNQAMRKARKEGGIDAKLMKARREAAKELKDSELKGAEKQQAINEKAGFTEKQSETYMAAMALKDEFTLNSLKLLTAKQQEQLPKKLQRVLKKAKRAEREKRKAEAA